MHEQTTLERSYRRLLLAYPGFYRRERGLEILTTMLEAARPGQLRATRAEAAHLLLSGLKCRLVPPGWAGKLAASVVTLWMAVVLGSVGAYFAWSTQSAAQPNLGDPTIAALSDALVGQHPSGISLTNADPLDMAYSHKSLGEMQTLAAEGWSGPRPVPWGHNRFYAQVDETQAVLANARQRLQADGWQTGVTTQPDDCACNVFWASRDGLLLRMSGNFGGDRPSMVVIRVHQVEPKGVFAAGIAGFVIGLVVSWLAMTWLGHRFQRTTRNAQRLVVILGLPALCAFAVNTVDSVLSMVPDPDVDAMLLGADLMYPVANLAANPLTAIIIGLGLAVSAAIIVFARRPNRFAPANSALPTRTVPEG